MASLFISLVSDINTECSLKASWKVAENLYIFVLIGAGF